MATVVYLVRNASTAWSADKRITGRRDIGLSPAGIAEAESLAKAFVGRDISELVSSPAPRAFDTATRIAEAAGVEVTRDPRLIDFAVGPVEGKSYVDEAVRKELGTLIDAQAEEVRDRLVSSVSQLLSDNELGSHIVVVSHAGPVALLLAHYLGIPRAEMGTRARLSAGKMAILAFDSERAPPRVLGMDVDRCDP